MSRDEVERLRLFHEKRCLQQKVRTRDARCERSAAAHIRLLHLHQLMLIDLTVSPSAYRSESAIQQHGRDDRRTVQPAGFGDESDDHSVSDGPWLPR